MSTILLATFESVDNSDINPFINILASLPETVDDVRLASVILSSDEDYCVDFLELEISLQEPSALIFLSQNPNFNEITIEQTALNCYKDNEISDNSEEEIPVTLPTSVIKEALNNKSLPVKEDNTKFCDLNNFILYKSLESKPDIDYIGQLIFPFTNEQDENSNFTQDDILEAIKATITEVIKL